MERELEELQRLITAGLSAHREDTVMETLCRGLIDAGLDLHRVAVGSEVLHPIFGARGITWMPEHGVAVEDFDRDRADGEDWLRSPFHFMLKNEIPKLRLRLDDTFEEGRFPLLDRLRREGATDYFAMVTDFAPNTTLGELDGLLWSFAVRSEDGFSEHQIELIKLFMPAASLAIKAVNANVTGRILMATYLGHDAGRRVVSGSIDRGSTETVSAALWFSDLEGFTQLADVLPHDQVIALLNDYAECIVKIIHAHHGQVLKFMGDGILAMFPFAKSQQACVHALNAASELGPAIAALNAARREQELATTQVFLGLHVGEVLYGNIGSRERLDFTVVGPAVNEVARIEQLSRSLGQHIAVSEPFAVIADGDKKRLVSLGRYMLKGVGRPQELFTIDPSSRAPQTVTNSASARPSQLAVAQPDDA
ncbi:MAG: adenylate/guanylate cyclase domain-containing protein, partial [Pseudomonadota bacterium]